MSGFNFNSSVPDSTENGGRALKLQTDAPHLVSMGGDRLSTSVTLHPIPQGRLTLGSSAGVDIAVQGTGVFPVHCHIENSEGVVTIYPHAGKISIDGVKITTPTRLSQGAMLTIGRSNYMRFNHPAEAKLMKSVLPNPRISMLPITFEQDINQYEKKDEFEESSVLSKASTPEFISDTEEPPSSFLTKVSKFEYLAAQNLKKSISPKVFSSNAVTVNTPAKDVLGKSPPNIHNLAKHLPQNALNYSELNHNKNQKVKACEWPLLGKKSAQYVNVSFNDTNNINNRVVVYENGIKPQNVNIDDKEQITKSSGRTKNINIQRIATPSPAYNRNPDPYLYISSRPVFNSNAVHRQDNSLTQLPNDDPNERKKEIEIKRNQAHQDRIHEQELEKTEQARLEEILNMCAEYEKQSRIEKNKLVSPNRIKTNGSLPRDKRSSPFNTSPASLGVFNFPPTYSSLPRNKVTSNYENITYSIPDISTADKYSSENNYENTIFKTTASNHPSSPRTRIKTFVTSYKDHLPDNTNMGNNFNLTKTKQLLSENMNNNKDTSLDNSIISCSSKRSNSPKFIESIENRDLATNSELNSNKTSGYSNISPSNIEYKKNRTRYECLKNEKKLLLDVIANIKKLISEIEIQEEELHIEMDMERALLLGEHKCKLLDVENLRLNKAKLIKKAQIIENFMQDAQHRQIDHQIACQKRLTAVQVVVAEIEKKLASTEKSSEDYEAVFEQYLKSQEVLDGERKSFEDLEFHHLEEEANWLASREELQREIVDLSSQIENLHSHIQELEQQSSDTANANNNEYKLLESQKINYLVRLEEMRNKLKHVDASLAEFSDQESEHEISSDSDCSKSKKSIDGGFEPLNDLSNSVKFEVSDTMETSNMSNSQCEFYQEAELGSEVVKNEKGRVKTVNDSAEHEQRTEDIHNCSSVTSIDSEDLPDTKKSYQNHNISAETPSYSKDRNEIENETDQRPLSEGSEMSLEGGHFIKRGKQDPDKQRPLTRYLPIASSNLDLKHHIKCAGHQVVLCPHILINSTSCRGFLHKKGSKLNGWSKRWFVFDRSMRTFSYFSDKSEKKARGGAYFQAIEEVYIDHLKSVKAPNPQLTFVVKTHERCYYLMAPSPEAMRIWVDVIFTGAEGYHEF